MKKLIVGMFALCAAVAAQAAYVDWQYKMTDKKTGGTDYSSGYTAYLLTSAAWDGIKDSFDQTTLASKATDSSVFYQSSAGKSSYSYSTGAGVASIRQATGDSGNYYVILANADGYNVLLDNVTVASYEDATTVGTTPTALTITTARDASGGISMSAYPSGGGDVPEPTSGLLLLVGGAMLALRRKQK